MAHPYSLAAQLHCKLKTIRPDLQHNLFLRDTAIAWREIPKTLHLPPTSLGTYQPYVPLGLDNKIFSLWQHKGLTEFSFLCDMESGTPPTFAVIAEKFSLPKSHVFITGNVILPIGKNTPQAASFPLCRQSKPSLTHRFWTCKYISTFWDQVISYIHRITLLQFPKDPLLLIFGYVDEQLLMWSPNVHVRQGIKKSPANSFFAAL